MKTLVQLYEEEKPKSSMSSLKDYYNSALEETEDEEKDKVSDTEDQE